MLTSEELAWLAVIEQEWISTTPGHWYAHLTDDAYSMSASYVSTEIGEIQDGFVVDSGNRMAAGWPEQMDYRRVVAITGLQEPRLVDPDQSEQNALFIANIHQHVPHLLTLIRRMKDTLHTVDERE